MLKVVGASSEQTRACSYILASLLLIGVGVVLFSGNIGHEPDAARSPNVYTATAHWSPATGCRVEFWGSGPPAAGAARAVYTHGLPATGWAQLEIRTNTSYADTVQAYTAGFLEGSLTWQLVHWRWANTIEVACARDEERCERVRARLRAASDAVRARAETLGDYYPFWHQVRLLYEQLDGLEAGWWFAVRRNKRDIDIPADDFLWMNVGTELLRHADAATAADSFAFVALHQDTVQVAHSTATIYGDLLRIVKKYTFGFHEINSPDSKRINGNTIIFSGYPGSVVSRDHLYMSGRLVVVGGARRYAHHKTVFSDVVMENARVIAATRLAADGRAWAGHYVSKARDVANAYQWAVVDTSRLPRTPPPTDIAAPPTPTATTSKFISALHDKHENSHHDKEERVHWDDDDGLLWLIEGMKSADLSSKLRRDGFWAGHNAAYIADLYTASSENLTTAEDILQLMRQVARLSPCAHGGRGDLCSLQPAPFGFIDTKVVTGDLHEDGSSSLRLKAISGPIFLETETVDVPPFSWSGSVFHSVPHVGQPDYWDFPVWTPTWN